MKKKIIAFVSMLALFMVSINLIHAAPSSYIIDEFDVLEAEEEKRLNTLAQQIEQDYGIGVYFAYLQNEEISDLDVTTVVGNQKNYLFMAENDKSWISRAGGIVEEYMTDVETESFRKAYDNEQTYVGGVKAYFESVEQWLQDEELSVLPQEQQSTEDDKEDSIIETPIVENTGIVKTTSNLYDGADLFNDTQEQQLLTKINEIITTHQVDMVIATIESCGDQSIDSYIGQFYDQNGYGIGENKDGVLFLISMGEREFRILSNGLGADAISSSDINSITEMITPDLAAGNYANALASFLDECEYQINGEINGFPFPFATNGLMSLVAGFAAAFFTTSSMKGELKSVEKQKQAKDYMKKGSMQLTNANEFFLYHTISRQKKASSSSSSSSRSSGSSRNVGGGSF